MTEQQGEPNNIAAAVHPGYPNPITGFDWIMFLLIASGLVFVAIWSLALWWITGRTLLGVVVGVGFPVVVGFLLYPRHCGEL
jgi:hypothetical protein